VKKGKPDPEGLHLLLDGAPPRDAIYLGDNIDDALAAKRARVPFLGVLLWAAKRIASVHQAPRIGRTGRNAQR